MLKSSGHFHLGWNAKLVSIQYRCSYILAKLTLICVVFTNVGTLNTLRCGGFLSSPAHHEILTKVEKVKHQPRVSSLPASLCLSASLPPYWGHPCFLSRSLQRLILPLGCSSSPPSLLPWLHWEQTWPLITLRAVKQSTTAVVRRFICRFGSSGADPVLCTRHCSSTLFVCLCPATCQAIRRHPWKHKQGPINCRLK